MEGFRTVGQPDQVDDNIARVNTAELKELRWPIAIVKALLVLAPPLLVFLGAYVDTCTLLGAICKAVVFVSGLVLLYVQAVWIDRLRQRDVLGVADVLFSRLIFVIVIGMFWFFVYRLWQLRSYGYLLPVLLVPLIVMVIRAYFARRQTDVIGRLMTYIGVISYYLTASFQLLLATLMIALAVGAMVVVGVRLSFGYRPRKLEPSPSTKEADQSLSVIHLSDLHFMDGQSKTGLEGGNRNAETEQFLVDIAPNLAQTDLVAVTGDITDTGFNEEWKAADAVFSVLGNVAEQGRLATVPGNHDINVFMTYDRESIDGPTPAVKKKLGLFGLATFANRNVRLVRYLAFWDKWCGGKVMVQRGGKTELARDFLARHAGLLNDYADNPLAAKGPDNSSRVRAIYEKTFPSVLTLSTQQVRVYGMDSSAQTWHPLFNGMGFFGLRQLWRLYKILKNHPKNHAAVFLMHHHLLPGFSEARERGFDEHIQELVLITLDSVLFKWILDCRLACPAVILHGHTHFGAEYWYGKHQVFCAPSTGFGEAAHRIPRSTAVRHTFRIGSNGEIHWTGKVNLQEYQTTGKFD